MYYSESWNPLKRPNKSTFELISWTFWSCFIKWIFEFCLTTLVANDSLTIVKLSRWPPPGIDLSSACNYNIRDLHRIRHTLNLKTASVIATSLVHSKLDYCNSLYLNLPQKQISRLQLLQNSLVRTVTGTPKIEHITLVLKSLHWLKIDEHIH